MPEPLSLKIGFMVTYELDGQPPADTSAFQSALAQGNQPISAYVPELTQLDPQGSQVFIGELTMLGHRALPYQSAIQQNGGGYTLDLSYATDAINAIGALLERVFWIPVEETRIDGYFGFEVSAASIEVNGSWQTMQVIVPAGEAVQAQAPAPGFWSSIPVIGSAFGDAPAIPELAEPLAQIAVERLTARLQASNLDLADIDTTALATQLVHADFDGSDIGDGGGGYIGVEDEFFASGFALASAGTGGGGGQSPGALRMQGQREPLSSGGVAMPGMCRGGGKHVGT